MKLKKPLEFINAFSRVVGVKLNLHANEKQTEKGIRETIPFPVTAKQNKQTHRTNITKEAKCLNNENCKDTGRKELLERRH